jgi:GNAT superfamily N-acetyltransferase
MTIAKTTVEVRPAGPEDEPRVLELLDAALGGGPAGSWTPELFRWKHAENPFGQSFMLVTESGSRIVGLRAFMRWRFEIAGRNVSAVRAVDTATHPDYQGRGIFSRLTLAALDALRSEVDLVFNTPNEKSLPGYLKMGWRSVGRVPVSIRVLRPARFLRGLRRRGGDPDRARPVSTAVPAEDALADGDTVARLLEVCRTPSARLETSRTPEYLLWRYGERSGLGYRAVGLEEGGRLRSLAIFRTRSRGRMWESTVAEVLTPPGDWRAARRLLQEVGRSTRVDHVACHASRGSSLAVAARRAGFLRLPMGMTFVVNDLRERTGIDPFDLRSWNLSLGDLEVF